MKIDSIDVYLVSMPLKYPFRTAFGNDSSIESVLVRMTSGSYYGWGESAPWERPAYSAEYAGGAYDCIKRFLAPLLLDRSIDTSDELQQNLSLIKGNYFAKAALDLAWWDINARIEGKPLWQVLGGKSPEVIVGADFGVMESIDMLLDAIDGAVQEGFQRVKLKYRPGWDNYMVKAVRDAFPEQVFHIDCNAAYTLDNSSMFKELDDYSLAMIEQPLSFDDISDHAELARQIQTPVCLDESIISLDAARKALDLKACGWVNIKPGRVGGITNSLKIHDYCMDRGIPCWIGGMLESAVGASHCLALATLENIRYPSDIFPSERFYVTDLGSPPLTLSGPSRITAQPLSGCGAEPDEKELGNRVIAHTSLK